MTIDPRTDDPVQTLLDVIALEETEARTREDIFLGRSHFMPTGRVFGGQVLSQAVSAAARTIPEGRFAHSLHGYFLRPGDVTKDITFGVDRIHDGRSFARRRVQGYQDGVPIFSGILSFQDDEEGFEHHLPMPDVPAPEDLPENAAGQDRHPLSRRLLAANPIEVRRVDGDLVLDAQGDPKPAQAVWTRVRRPIGDSRLLHQAALAYLSDYTIQEPSMRGAGLSWSSPGINVASLDHAMWWHRPGRADEWILYVQESPGAQGGRGLAFGRLYTRDGVLIASVAQEIMARLPRG
ncbi:acyl-CoA thioesterase II [Microbacterium betulae]|uniref:Acyl-CoA thioesterase II n=1 Tax=Microbacterium betulae TaxID=2981139 RepID=A0AA97FM56_9MICO|nr:acyl-CoA thioesterase II [Microbacterium sp. AB]WOF24564.1 acyl-CoA thioesterase II [Microbacterium sp. AB]